MNLEKGAAVTSAGRQRATISCGRCLQIGQQQPTIRLRIHVRSAEGPAWAERRSSTTYTSLTTAFETSSGYRGLHAEHARGNDNRGLKYLGTADYTRT